MADESLFKPGLEGVVAFESEIAEPDKEGSALRYRGVDIEELVGRVPFEKVWGLLIDGACGWRAATGWARSEASHRSSRPADTAECRSRETPGRAYTRGAVIRGSRRHG